MKAFVVAQNSLILLQKGVDELLRFYANTFVDVLSL